MEGLYRYIEKMENGSPHEKATAREGLLHYYKENYLLYVALFKKPEQLWTGKEQEFYDMMDFIKLTLKLF